MVIYKIITNIYFKLGEYKFMLSSIRFKISEYNSKDTASYPLHVHNRFVRVFYYVFLEEDTIIRCVENKNNSERYTTFSFNAF